MRNDTNILQIFYILLFLTRDSQNFCLSKTIYYYYYYLFIYYYIRNKSKYQTGLKIKFNKFLFKTIPIHISSFRSRTL